VSVAALVLVIPMLTVNAVLAHDGPHRDGAPPAERIDPSRVYPFAVVAGGGGHFHVLQIMPGARRLFAGTHLGLFVSEDRGLTWRLAAARFSGVDVRAVARDQRTGALYAATRGHGLLVSRNGGGRWVNDSRGLPGSDVHALALDPGEPHPMYVWSVGHGLFARRTERAAWERLAGPDALPGVESLAVDPRDPERLYAGTARGVWVSRDGGRAWTLPPDGLRDRTAGIAVVPYRPDTLLAATFDGVFAGRADGTGWTPVEAAPSWWGPIVGFAFVAARPDTVFAVAHEGPVVTRSLDGGPWEPLAPAPGGAVFVTPRPSR
jgi:hypothetical protein